MSGPAMPFIDLAAQQARIRPRIEAAIRRVLDHGQYVMGPEVEEFEERLAEFCGARHVIGCSSGTDALLMALMALDIRPGDAVLVPAFTFVATAEAVVLAGATPVFVDVDAESGLLPAAQIPAGAAAARDAGLAPRAVIAVDLYGHPADYPAIGEAAAHEGLSVVADAAQSLGATLGGRRVGTLAGLTATSFFPAKPLGAYGDGGAVLTDDDSLAARLRSIRMHGQGSDRYEHVRLGLNGRLDTLQAAILLEKLTLFEEELALRDTVARRYAEMLSAAVALPEVAPEATCAWAQYTIRSRNRDALHAALMSNGVPVAIHYPSPLHRQPAYRAFPRAAHRLPVSERLAGEVLSLPMHPYLDDACQKLIADTVRAAVADQSVVQ